MKKINLLIESKNRIRVIGEYLLYLTLPIFLILLLVIGSEFAPFGENSFAWADANITYFDLFANMKRVLSGDSSVFYTFEKALGGNNIVVYSFLLSSPLNILVIFFNVEDFNVMLTVLVMLKSGLAGLTFGIYIKHRFPKMRFPLTLALSLGYALCQYNLSQASNIMWLDGVYMLPLMLLGVYRLVKSNNKSKVFLIVVTGLAIVFNWYSGAINCVFCVFYYFYEDLRERRISSLFDYLRRIGAFAACMMLGVLLSMFIFFPTLLSMTTEGGRGSIDWGVLSNIRVIEIFSVISEYQPGAGRLSGAPGNLNLFCGFLAMIGIFGYSITNSKQESFFQRIVTIAFLLLVIAFFYFSPFVFLFSLLKSVMSYWYRYSYVGSCAILAIAAHFYERVGNEMIEVEKKKVIPTLIVFFWVVLGFGVLESQLYVLSIGIVLVAYVYLANKQYSFSESSNLVYAEIKLLKRVNIVDRKLLIRISSALLAYLLVFIISQEMMLNAKIAMSIYRASDSSSYSEYVLSAKEQIKTLKEYDKDTYRINQTSTRNMDNALTANYNEPLAFGFNSLNTYSNDADSRVMVLLHKLGYNIMGENMNIVNTSILGADSLLGVKYVLSKYDINGLNKIDELGVYNSKATYLNPHSLPLAFTYDETDLTYDMNEWNPFVFQNQLYSYLLGENVEIYKSVGFATSEDGSVMTLNKVPTPHAIYGCILTTYWEYCDVYVDGGLVATIGGWLSPLVFYVPSDDTRGADVSVSNTRIRHAMYFYLDLLLLEEVTAKIQARGVEIQEFRDGYVACAVNGSLGDKLHLSVPYEESWKITNNGRPASVELVGDCLISIVLSEGENNIVLEYGRPGLAGGITLSVLAITLIVCIYICDKKNINVFLILKKYLTQPTKTAADKEEDLGAQK